MLWKLRAIVYGGVAIVVALLLIGGGEQERPAFAEGRTSQDKEFRMEFENGRPINLGTTFLQSCAGGEPWAARWWSFDGRTARFRFDDGRLVVREKLRREYDNGDVGERNYTLEATVADGRVTGTMRLIENLDASGAWYVCESGDVSFSAG